MSEGEQKKARLESLWDEITETLDTVRDEMKDFKTVRNLAKGEEGDLNSAKFYIDVGNGQPIEIPAPNITEDMIEAMMDRQGSKVAATWTTAIKPLVDEAVGICQQASERSDEDGE